MKGKVVPIIHHDELPETRGYYSKIINRSVVTSEVGAKTCTVWDQTIPPGGYIVPHSHEFEETLTFLTGSCIHITIDDASYHIEAETTVFIPAGTVHSVRNEGAEPVRLIAFLASSEPKMIYTNVTLSPVEWE